MMLQRSATAPDTIVALKFKTEKGAAQLTETLEGRQQRSVSIRSGGKGELEEPKGVVAGVLQCKVVLADEIRFFRTKGDAKALPRRLTGETVMEICWRQELDGERSRGGAYFRRLTHKYHRMAVTTKSVVFLKRTLVTLLMLTARKKSEWEFSRIGISRPEDQYQKINTRRSITRRSITRKHLPLALSSMAKPACITVVVRQRKRPLGMIFLKEWPRVGKSACMQQLWASESQTRQRSATVTGVAQSGRGLAKGTESDTGTRTKCNSPPHPFSPFVPRPPLFLRCSPSNTPERERARAIKTTPLCLKYWCTVVVRE